MVVLLESKRESVPTLQPREQWPGSDTLLASIYASQNVDSMNSTSKMANFHAWSMDLSFVGRQSSEAGRADHRELLAQCS